MEHYASSAICPDAPARSLMAGIWTRAIASLMSLLSNNSRKPSESYSLLIHRGGVGFPGLSRSILPHGPPPLGGRLGQCVNPYEVPILVHTKRASGHILKRHRQAQSVAKYSRVDTEVLAPNDLCLAVHVFEHARFLGSFALVLVQDPFAQPQMFRRGFHILIHIDVFQS